MPVSRCVGSWEGASSGQLTWTYHRVSYSVCELRGGGQGHGRGTNQCLGISDRVVSNCIVHNLSVWVLFLSLFAIFLFSIIFYSYLLLFLLFIKLFLSQPKALFFFPILLLSHWKEEEWASSCFMLSCWLGLNHSTMMLLLPLYWNKWYGVVL